MNERERESARGKETERAYAAMSERMATKMIAQHFQVQRQSKQQAATAGGAEQLAAEPSRPHAALIITINSIIISQLIQ